MFASFSALRDLWPNTVLLSLSGFRLRHHLSALNIKCQKRIDFRHILTTSCEQLFDNIGFEPNSAYI
jgi:hypothetical protein